MTDGPFNNLVLGRRWRRYADALLNDAVDSAERCALASDAIVQELLTDDTQALIKDLQIYASKKQLDFDPVSSIEMVFNNHDKTSFADTLQKELAFRLNEQTAPEIAIAQALDASVCDHIGEAKNRIEEECVHLRESGEMRQEQFDRAVNNSNATFDILTISNICDALRACDKFAFKKAASKKEGLDEGPSRDLAPN